MSIRTNSFMLGLLIPLMAMANITNSSISRINTRVAADATVVELTSNSKSESPTQFGERDKFFKEDLSEGWEGTRRLAPSSKSVPNSIYNEEASQEKMWPVQIQIKGLSPESPHATPYYFNANTCAQVRDYEMEDDIMTILVPEGLNDIVILYAERTIVDEIDGRPIWVNRGGSYYIIENVEVGADTPMLMADIDECHAIPLDLRFGNGEKVVFPTMKWNGQEFDQVSQGNVTSGILQSLFYNSDYDFRVSFSYFKQLQSDVEGYENIALEFWQTKINKASDKWVFANMVTILDSDDNPSMLSWLITPNTEKVTFTKEDFCQIPWNFSIDSENGIKGFSCSSYFSINNSFWEKSKLGQMVEVLKDRQVDFYMTNKDFRINNNTSDWNLSFDSLIATEAEIDEEEGEFYLYGIQSPRLMLERDGGVYTPETTVFAAKPYQNSLEGWSSYDEANWGVQEFNYNDAQTSLEFNASAPYVVTYFGYEGQPDSEEILLYYPESTIYGLAGEDRNMLDWMGQKYTVTFNGEAVNQPGSSIFEFIYGWHPNEEGEGILRIDVDIDTNLFIDGIQAKNTRTLILHQGAKDWTPPTLTCIQIRNNENIVTNKFDNASEGHIILSASDIYPGVYWEYWEDWDEWMPYSWNEIIYGAEVNVEVSPCGEETWEVLEIAATGKKSPALGDFYEVPLNQITASSENGWYDLRVTVTDNTGNSQQQTITPAFYINNGQTGVNTNQTTIPATVKAIYNISGNQLNSMQTGLNIVVYSDGSCRKVMMK